MRRARKLLSAGLLGLVVLTLAACGGPDANDRADVRQAVRSMLIEGKFDCARLGTGLSRSLGGGPLTATECRDYKKHHQLARAVKFSQMKFHGDRSQVDVDVEGGDNDGSHLTLAAGKKDGHWKILGIVSMAIDRPRFERAFRAVLIRPPTSLPPRVASCVIRGLRQFSDARLELGMLRGDTSFARPATKCLLEEEIAKRTDADSRLAKCVVRRTVAPLSDGELTRFLAGDAAAAKRTDDAMVAAAKRCAGQR
jgi:hypothetical protein